VWQGPLGYTNSPIPGPPYIFPNDKCAPKLCSNSAKPLSSIKTYHYQTQLIEKCTGHLDFPRAHGLIRKVPRANRYVLTEKGRKFSVALLTASALDIKALTEKAA